MSRQPKAHEMANRNQQILAMQNVRVFYRKTGRAKYISHLDITRCMQRALKRAEIPVWYTQGFHPHMYLTFALPLALGYESLCECMDFRLEIPIEFEEIKLRLNKALPPDITVTNVQLQKEKPQTIAKADYTITFVHPQIQELAQEWETFCNKSEILVMKRTKKKEKEIDLKPEFEQLERSFEEQQVTYLMRFTAGQKNVNPTLLIDAFFQAHDWNKPVVQVVRKQIYTQDGAVFE